MSTESRDNSLEENVEAEVTDSIEVSEDNTNEIMQKETEDIISNSDNNLENSESNVSDTPSKFDNELENNKKKKDKREKKLNKKKKNKATDGIEEDTENAEDDINNYVVDEDGNFVKKSKRKLKKVAKKNKNVRKPEEVNIVKDLLGLIVYFAIVALGVCFILTFVGSKALVRGESMYPTLNNSDHLWVDKLSYRFGNPKRFDVIIFDYDEDNTFVKRIIGLPGETVQIDTNGNIYINDKVLVEDYGYERIAPTKIGRASEPILLGDGEYFVLGDNRNDSRDSRSSDVGNVVRDDIIGKVIIRTSPIKNIGFVK